MSKTVDARGQVCPKPIILTKKALTEVAVGESFTVLIDNETSKLNVEKFLADNHEKYSTTLDGKLVTISVTKQAKELIAPDAESYCSTSPAKPPVVAIAAETMGSGADELGAILMKAFINTIKEVSPPPSHILFYNGGVHLTTEGSPLIDPLKELEAKGIAVMSCGTCLDYYKKKEKLKVGTITNMFTILETLAGAGIVIRP
jgi:selenium metabolism protein YedF